MIFIIGLLDHKIKKEECKNVCSEQSSKWSSFTLEVDSWCFRNCCCLFRELLPNDAKHLFLTQVYILWNQNFRANCGQGNFARREIILIEEKLSFFRFWLIDWWISLTYICSYMALKRWFIRLGRVCFVSNISWKNIMLF